MAIETKAQLLERFKELAVENARLQSIINKRNDIVKAKDRIIKQLESHLQFINAQKDRLVGFIEGRESITSPEIDAPDIGYQPHIPQKVNRTEKFLRECTTQFVKDDNGIIVTNDSFRNKY